MSPPSRLKGESFERSEEETSTCPPSRLKGESFERSEKGNFRVPAGRPECPVLGRWRAAQAS
jgi:hypothetical protein